LPAVKAKEWGRINPFFHTTVNISSPEYSTVDRNIHPLLGVYPKSILRELENYLKSDRKKVLDFLTGAGYNLIDLSAYRNRIININTENEYRSLINTRADV
jgi:molybdopterin-guanine dinucleotide biosynthesis protein A